MTSSVLGASKKMERLLYIGKDGGVNYHGTFKRLISVPALKG
jgi:hypothetical protein